jgi:hypothetical protein
MLNTLIYRATIFSSICRYCTHLLRPAQEAIRRRDEVSDPVLQEDSPVRIDAPVVARLEEAVLAERTLISLYCIRDNQLRSCGCIIVLQYTSMEILYSENMFYDFIPHRR